MKDSEYFQVQARAMRIRDESGMFIETCKMNIKKAGSLRDDAARLCEEAMILEEECIAVKSKSLAILRLSNQFKNLPEGSGVQLSSIEDDTTILLQMIDEIRQAPLPAENPLHSLRAELLGLSFLPGHDLLPPGAATTT
ncbi:MAG TPA: hypothetical protein VMV48_03495 [Gallionellaceae bacterium]|nr:hypothetical protein [Gallionellaceae bacterium]